MSAAVARDTKIAGREVGVVLHVWVEAEPVAYQALLAILTRSIALLERGEGV
jgi:hypothetical protein